jgi:PKD repeat protein
MSKIQCISIQRIFLFFMICSFLCVIPALAKPDQDTQTSISIAAVILPTPLHAAFIANPLTGAAPLTVQFSDQSTGQITSWLWDFGDGSSSAQQIVTHIYTTHGKYTVSLTVTGPGGANKSVKTNYITVTKKIKKPKAQFEQDVHSGRAPVTVHFTDQSSNDPTSFLWEFGDGSSSTVENPSHVYTRTGIYSVQFTATNSAGSDTAKGIVVVLPQHWPKDWPQHWWWDDGKDDTPRK